MEDVLTTLVCAECSASSELFERGWRAYRLDDPKEKLLVLCPTCAEREFGEDEHQVDL